MNLISRIFKKNHNTREFALSLNQFSTMLISDFNEHRNGNLLISNNHTNFPETERPSRSISSLRTGTLQPGCSSNVALNFYRGNFRKAFHRGLQGNGENGQLFTGAAIPARKASECHRDERSGKSGRFTFPSSRGLLYKVTDYYPL